MCIVAERRQDQTHIINPSTSNTKNCGSYLKFGAVTHHLVNLSRRLSESIHQFIISAKLDKTMRGSQSNMADAPEMRQCSQITIQDSIWKEGQFLSRVLGLSSFMPGGEITIGLFNIFGGQPCADGCKITRNPRTVSTWLTWQHQRKMNNNPQV